MADDLDELLDEVESKFFRTVCPPQPTPAPNRDDGGNLSNPSREKDGKSGTSGSARKDSPVKVTDEEIDALLEDIMHQDYNSVISKVPETARAETNNSVLQPTGKKCCPVLLGGTSIATGFGTSISHRACSHLRCTSCDFHVATFDDYEWDPSCNYLFFRNNMPTQDKLRTKQRKRRGSRAYACQCSWYTAVQPTELRELPHLKWVCGTH